MKASKKFSGALPQVLDLLALVMQAGLDFQMALKQLVTQMPQHPLRDEFQLVWNDIQLGHRRVEALRALQQRTADPHLKETLYVLIQGIELGSSLVPLLRQQADTVRQKQSYQAEKAAALVPLKLMFPLFVFIFPTLLILLFGPLWVSFTSGQL
jgi:tight adherence protein C